MVAWNLLWLWSRQVLTKNPSFPNFKSRTPRTTETRSWWPLWPALFGNSPWARRTSSAFRWPAPQFLLQHDDQHHHHHHHYYCLPFFHHFRSWNWCLFLLASWRYNVNVRRTWFLQQQKKRFLATLFFKCLIHMETIPKKGKRCFEANHGLSWENK